MPATPQPIGEGGRAKPQTLVKGRPGVRLELAVTFQGGRKHLPTIMPRVYPPSFLAGVA
ncbi:MAG: hypothetical protein IMZ44_05675 [Planctomycetes bacterium]|nr:hypothetical protein [Planctomycetota bacterium]